MANTIDRTLALDAYRALRPTYVSFADRLENLIEGLSDQSSIHFIHSRAKDEKSFQEKSLRKDEKNGEFVYFDPINQIEDLAGVRVICYTVSQVDAVCNAVRDNFDVLEHIDKAKELLASGKVGYVSRHFIVKIDERRSILPEYKDFKNLKCEVQIRTIFQHAWAEIEHRLQYKASPDFELRSRFQALAGFVQVADREFESVFQLGRRLAETVNIPDEAVPTEDDLAGDGAGHKLSNAAYRFGVTPSQLVAAGQYDNAIQAYTGLIALQPNQVWHYVGRAKAHALAGNSLSVEDDLETIQRLKSKDGRVSDTVERIRSMVR
jgi:putative GTP pyrophosphokinase